MTWLQHGLVATETGGGHINVKNINVKNVILHKRLKWRVNRAMWTILNPNQKV